MANKFPIILSSANRFAELAAGDNLDLQDSNIVNAAGITTVGTVSANAVTANSTSISGNITVGNAIVNGAVSATTAVFSGNVTAGNTQANNFTGVNFTATGNASIGNATVLGTAQFSNSAVTFGTGNSNVQIYGSNATVYAATFYGNLVGNTQGNLTVTGANTGVVFKDAGVANALSGFTFDKTSNTVAIGGFLTVASNVTAGNALFNNSVVITGNLRVDGNTTFINANTLVVGDKDIVLANNAAVASDANGAGILVGSSGQFASIVWRYAGNLWDFSGNIAGDVAYFDNLEVVGNITNLANTNVTGNVTASNIIASANIQSQNATISANLAAGNVLTNNLLYANGTPWDLQQPAGANTQLQFNDGNSNFGASANLTFDRSTNLLTVAGNITADFVQATVANIQQIFYTGNLSTGSFSITQQGVEVSAGLSSACLSPQSLVINSNDGAVGITLYGNASASSTILINSQELTIGSVGNVLGNVRADNFFGNLAGNFNAPGSNTQILFNDSGLANATAGLTFTKTSNALAASGNIIAAGNISGTFVLGNGQPLTGQYVTVITRSNGNVQVPVNA